MRSSSMAEKVKRHLSHDVPWRGQVARGVLFNFRGGTFSEGKPIGDMAYKVHESRYAINTRIK